MISQHHKSWIYSWAVQKAWTSDKKYKLVLTEVKMRIDQRFTVVIYWKKKCKCVHWVRVVSLKTNNTSASPGFSAGRDNKPSMKCRRGIKTRCHRRRSRCWCGPTLDGTGAFHKGEPTFNYEHKQSALDEPCWSCTGWKTNQPADASCEMPLGWLAIQSLSPGEFPLLGVPLPLSFYSAALLKKKKSPGAIVTQETPQNPR